MIRLALVLALLAGPALAQQTQQTQGLPGGDPAVQSTAPEVGAGRGAPNAQVPETSDPATPTGGPRPAEPQAVAPTAPRPVQEIPAPPPFAGRGGQVASELELEAALRNGTIAGRVSIPNQSAGLLIQPDGRTWRGFRNWPLVIVGAVAVLGALLAVTLYHLLRGTRRLEGGRSGRVVQRFNWLERANHWMVAVSFILLALTGLNITYGAWLLRPLIGPEAFTTLSYAAQSTHHFVSFAFLLGVLVMAVLWIRQNLPNRGDVQYIMAGGPMAKRHIPTGKFNAGQKILFWFVVLAGLAVAASGYVLMAPYLLDDVIGQQWAHMVHGLLGMVMVGVIIGHIYIGTLGMEGAFEAMRDGTVDQNWAREHHDLWYQERLNSARQTVGPPAAPAE